MADLTNNEAAQTVKITGADTTGLETTPVASTSNGALHSSLRDSSGSELASSSQSPLNDVLALITRNIPQKLQTYSTSVDNLNTAANATDVFTITGSADRVVKVKKIVVSATQTTTSKRLVNLVKRASANSEGTSSTITAVPHDSLNVAASSTVRSYTANPTLGTTVGVLRSQIGSFGTITPSNAQSASTQLNVEFNFGQDTSQEIILRGTSEVLAVNFGGVSWTGDLVSIFIEWTEE